MAKSDDARAAMKQHLGKIIQSVPGASTPRRDPLLAKLIARGKVEQANRKVFADVKAANKGGAARETNSKRSQRGSALGKKPKGTGGKTGGGAA